MRQCHADLYYCSPSRIGRIATGTHFSSSYSPSTEFIVSRIDPKGYLQIASYKFGSPPSDKAHDGPTLLWQSSIRYDDIASSVFQTSSVPLELEVIIQGFCESPPALREHGSDVLQLTAVYASIVWSRWLSKQRIHLSPGSNLNQQFLEQSLAFTSR